MPIVSHDENRLVEALEYAESSFWDAVTDKYPEATAGDLSPCEAIKLETAMRSALTEWLMFNCDTPPSPPKVVEIMLHRIEYNYYDEDMELTEGDEEHIAYSISQGISEGELCTTTAKSTECCGLIVRGYWKINNNPDA